jgi:DNA polymerase delta subunit 4
MPATRRTSRKAAAPPAALQSKLSFHGTSNKVTKSASNQSKETKAALKKDPALLDSLVTKESTPTAEILPEADEEFPETTAEKAITEQAISTASSLPSRPRPSETINDDESQPTTVESVLGGRAAPNDSLGATNGLSGWLGDEEQRARKISDAQIKKYWRAKEAQRLAPRVHQEDLGVREKVLREWDMSGEFGVSHFCLLEFLWNQRMKGQVTDNLVLQPCIGIARLKRWKRANALGLDPPIEVLAVLLKEMEEGGAAKSQRAHVDELLSSRFVET